MRILIVEDEPRLAQMLRNNFSALGHASDIIFDGAEADRRIEASNTDYDLIVLDWLLPNMDGLQICKNARSKSITVPILMVSGKFDIKDKIAALDAGADDYMVKPFSLEELEARVRALLRRPRNLLGSVLEIGPLKLESSEHRVTIDNKVVRLTIKEFSILEYLMRNVGKVVSRQEIINHVWDFDFNSFSNVIDVHMKNLRHKLSRNKRSFIHTIRGVGYMIKVW